MNPSEIDLIATLIEMIAPPTDFNAREINLITPETEFIAPETEY